MTIAEHPSNLQQIEDQTFEEIDSFELPPSDIVAYNELRSCADLFRMYNKGILEIQPHFQRQVVWKSPAQTRFIDSLVKQLPIPSMCFSFDYRKQKWQVIDGLQRMWSIIRFLNGDEWRLSQLEDIDPNLSGQNVPDFKVGKPSLRQYYLRIENLTLPVTVIRCDYSKSEHMEYLFTIFHRLNSGAVRLNNQEIRNCIYSGTFNKFLRDLDTDPTWLRMNGRSLDTQDRYRGQEQILRFFAFHDDYRRYRGRLAAFLNGYMREHREPSKEFKQTKSATFLRTVRLASDSIFDGNPTERRSISVLEATLVGISMNLDYLESLPKRKVRQMYDELLNSQEFAEERLRDALSSTRRVQERMSAAINVFSSQGNG